MIYIIGAGGFAREVLNIFIDINRDGEIIGFLEENCQRMGNFLNGKRIDDISILDNINDNNIKLVCAIGTPLRSRLIESTKKLGFVYETVVHHSVIKSEWVTFGKGNIVCAGNIFTSQIIIGNYVIINLGCTVGHDVNIGAYTTISPGVHISGRVSIGDKCFIGTGTVIVEKISIGNGSFIGAGAVVTKDIPENVLAVGIPARPIRKLTEFEWVGLV